MITLTRREVSLQIYLSTAKVKVAIQCSVEAKVSHFKIAHCVLSKQHSLLTLLLFRNASKQHLQWKTSTTRMPVRY